jgi:hypothetical protein
MPKVICVRIRPSEKYLSNGFECSLGQIGHVDADGPTLVDLPRQRSSRTQVSHCKKSTTRAARDIGIGLEGRTALGKAIFTCEGHESMLIACQR